MSERPVPPPLGTTDFHVLLVLREKPLYGYAIKKAIFEESGGAVAPQIGSLYRILARLMDRGLVEEEEAISGNAPEVHPGLERRYYRLTALGEIAARTEASRLERVVALARSRDLLPHGGHS